MLFLEKMLKVPEGDELLLEKRQQVTSTHNALSHGKSLV
jgi:hypothetical protein